jgi:heptosyltransferase-1
MRILILRVSAIGDVIHTLPSIFLIKQSIPQARISWIVQKKVADLLFKQPFIENFWILPNRYLSPRHYSKTIPIIKQIRSIKWDAIIDFQGILKTSLILSFLKGKKYGFAKNHARSNISTFFTHNHTVPFYQNIVQKNLALTSDVIFNLQKTYSCPTILKIKEKFEFNFTAKSKETVYSWLKKKNIKNPILFCPNTTWPSKHWPFKRWEELIKLIINYNPTSPLVIVGKAFGRAAFELDSSIKKQKLPVYALPPWDLLTTATIIKKSSLVIAPDTGLLHLADFLGIQSIGIFGPTNKKKHGPFLKNENKQNAFQVSCSHSYQKNHAKRGFLGILDKDCDCMSALTAGMVFKKVKTILSL